MNEVALDPPQRETGSHFPFFSPPIPTKPTDIITCMLVDRALCRLDVGTANVGCTKNLQTSFGAIYLPTRKAPLTSPPTNKNASVILPQLDLQETRDPSPNTRTHSSTHTHTHALKHTHTNTHTHTQSRVAVCADAPDAHNSNCKERIKNQPAKSPCARIFRQRRGVHLIATPRKSWQGTRRKAKHCSLCNSLHLFCSPNEEQFPAFFNRCG
jgi:hypothetical protein